MQSLRSVLKSRTLSQSGITISATLINGILGLLFFVIAAKNLGPATFGILSFTTAFIALVSDIATLGTDTGLIRFIGKFTDLGDRKRILKLGFEVKIIAWAVVLILGAALIPFLSVSVFNKPELTFPLYLSLLGIGGSLLFSFTASALQAHQKFITWSILNVSSNSLRLIMTFVLIGASVLTLQSTLITYITLPIVMSLIGLMLLPRFFLQTGEWKLSKEFFNFNKWIALITILSAVGSRLDVLLSTRLLSISEVGVYSVAVQLTSFIPQIFFAIATVAAPMLANFTNKQSARLYLKKLQLLVFGVALLGLLGIPVGWFLIPKVYGLNYIQSITPFIILLLGNLIFLLALPSHQAIFYYFAKPKVMFFVSIIQTFVVFVSGWFLISSLGMIGAALSVVLGDVVLLLIPSLWVINALRNKA
jgi:O-antigen/teichoic acid export membrane protein